MANRKEVWATAPRGEGKKDFWIRVGTAFENRDGSWSLVLDALPTNGRLIVRDEREREQTEESPRREQPRPSTGGGFGGSRRNDQDDIPF